MMTKSTISTSQFSVFDGHAHQTGQDGLVSIILNRVANWRRRARINRLEALEDHMLDDIGVTRHDLMWAKGLPLDSNPLKALESRARDHARCRRQATVKALPGSPLSTIQRVGCA